MNILLSSIFLLSLLNQKFSFTQSGNVLVRSFVVITAPRYEICLGHLGLDHRSLLALISELIPNKMNLYLSVDWMITERSWWLNGIAIPSSHLSYLLVTFQLLEWQKFHLVLITLDFVMFIMKPSRLAISCITLFFLCWMFSGFKENIEHCKVGREV